MNNDLMAYIERLELMAFFAGYPLIYAIVQVIAGRKKPAPFINRLVKLLPFAYALSGTLFIGLLLKNLYPDYSIKNIAQQFQYPYLKIWGLLALLFWLPVFSKKPLFSLLHSLVFFFFLLKDLYIHITSHTGKEVIDNDMKIYTDSLQLNAGTLAATLIVYYLFNKIRDNRKASVN
jgi:hypothetical protein